MKQLCGWETTLRGKIDMYTLKVVLNARVMFLVGNATSGLAHMTTPGG